VSTLADRLQDLIDRHTTTTGEHPVSVAELRYAIDPEGETWDHGTPYRAGTCTSGCTPEDFS
jgi:hypothetical protein